jgi:hypothetical protein
VYGYEETAAGTTPPAVRGLRHENHPAVETSSRRLGHGQVDYFDGYQGDATDVRDEIEAVWTALADA